MPQIIDVQGSPEQVGYRREIRNGTVSTILTCFNAQNDGGGRWWDYRVEVFVQGVRVGERTVNVFDLRDVSRIVRDAIESVLDLALANGTLQLTLVPTATEGVA